MPDKTSGVRIDKWLWAVRIFKTRSMATEACKKGRVSVDGVSVKPSRDIKLGDKVFVRKPPVIYSYRVTGIIDNRVSAPLAVQNYEELTPEEELLKLEVNSTRFVKRDRGAGRPTKKERRTIDKLTQD
jgi:ribosome-associated heat shock protein Hsp15